MERAITVLCKKHFRKHEMWENMQMPFVLQMLTDNLSRWHFNTFKLVYSVQYSVFKVMFNRNLYLTLFRAWLIEGSFLEVSNLQLWASE